MSKWFVRKGTSIASVVASDYQAASQRAAYIGLADPDCVVQDDDRAIYSRNAQRLQSLAA